MQTVGVAPGTTTFQLQGLRSAPCPPEERRWFMPDRGVDSMLHVAAYPSGFKPYTKDLNGLSAGPQVTYYDLYQRDFLKLRGFGEVPMSRTRWDLIGLMGGGAIVVALLTGILAAR